MMSIDILFHYLVIFTACCIFRALIAQITAFFLQIFTLNLHRDTLGWRWVEDWLFLIVCLWMCVWFIRPKNASRVSEQQSAFFCHWINWPCLWWKYNLVYCTGSVSINDYTVLMKSSRVNLMVTPPLLF